MRQSRTINKTGGVIRKPNLQYCQKPIFIFFCDKTCSQSNVAKDPKGVILGPRLQPMMFAYAKASLGISFSAILTIIIAGKLFISALNNAEVKPTPKTETVLPFSARSLKIDCK